MSAKQTIRAKFECGSIEIMKGNKFVKLFAVHKGTEENKSFAKYTPGGNLTIAIDNGTQAANFFEVGKEYYLDFEEVIPNDVDDMPPYEQTL